MIVLHQYHQQRPSHKSINVITKDPHCSGTFSTCADDICCPFAFACLIIAHQTFTLFDLYRDSSSPLTPLKSLDTPNLYGYNRSVNNSESSTNSSGNSPDINSVTAENLNLIDLIVSQLNFALYCLIHTFSRHSNWFFLTNHNNFFLVRSELFREQCKRSRADPIEE